MFNYKTIFERGNKGNPHHLQQKSESLLSISRTSVLPMKKEGMELGGNSTKLLFLSKVQKSIYDISPFCEK
jgi:hypothetical protein